MARWFSEEEVDRARKFLQRHPQRCRECNSTSWEVWPEAALEDTLILLQCSKKGCRGANVLSVDVLSQDQPSESAS